MAKYSLEFKTKVVQSYLKGEGGYVLLSRKYNLPKTLVRTWVKAYTQFGFEGLSRCRKNKVYTVQEKLNAIELYLTTEMSMQDISNKMGLNNPSLFGNWLSKYRKEGINGLSKTKGRPTKMVKHKADTTQTKNEKGPKDIKNTEDRIKELEHENYMQRLEIAYLKELRRLQEKKRLPKKN